MGLEDTTNSLYGDYRLIGEEEVSLFQSLFRAVEENKYDAKLAKLLNHTLEGVYAPDEKYAHLQFKNGVDVNILYTFDGYYLGISKPSLYFNNENSRTKMTSDRVLFYLQQIGNWKYD